MSPLQRRVWQIATGLAEADTVALAGSGGLIVRGVVDRTSRDVDLFATDVFEVERVVPALIAALAAEGYVAEVFRTRWGHVSLRVEGMGDSTEVDIGTQMRLNPTEQTPYGVILSLDDLAAGKLIALFDRGAERDYVDVVALTAQYTFAELCDLTEARQPRFDRQQFANDLRQFGDEYSAEDFETVDLYNKIHQKVTDWLQELTDQG